MMKISFLLIGTLAFVFVFNVQAQLMEDVGTYSRDIEEVVGTSSGGGVVELRDTDPDSGDGDVTNGDTNVAAALCRQFRVASRFCSPNIREVNLVSPVACCGLCITTGQCRCWSWTNGAQCWLKKDCGRRTTDLEYFSGVPRHLHFRRGDSDSGDSDSDVAFVARETEGEGEVEEEEVQIKTRSDGDADSDGGDGGASDSPSDSASDGDGGSDSPSDSASDGDGGSDSPSDSASDGDGGSDSDSDSDGGGDGGGDGGSTTSTAFWIWFDQCSNDFPIAGKRDLVKRNIKECVQECRETDGCVCINWYPTRRNSTTSSGRCTLKYAAGGTQIRDRDCMTACLTTLGRSQCNITSGVTFDPFDTYLFYEPGAHPVSPPECCELCAETASCEAWTFSWVERGGMCYLMSQASDLDVDEDWDVGTILSDRFEHPDPPLVP
jgi:hypothetical protein